MLNIRTREKPHPMAQYASLLSAMLSYDFGGPESIARNRLRKTARLWCQVADNIDYMERTVNWSQATDIETQLYQFYTNLLPLINGISKFFIMSMIDRQSFYTNELKGIGLWYDHEHIKEQTKKP